MDLKFEHLVGRDFIHGSDDCYGLQRQFWKDNFELDFPDYARPDNWWDQGMDLYSDNFADCGFHVMEVRPDKVQLADVFLMAVRSRVSNHAAVYVGGGKILHHFIGRRSEVIEYSGLWRNKTTAILRHESLLNWKPKNVRINLESVAL